MHRAQAAPRRSRLLTAVRSRAARSTALELFGAGAVTVGAGMVYLPAGCIVGGLLAIALGWLIGDDS